MALAFTFPGQGSQFVGMGYDLSAAFQAARDVFDEVDEALGQNLSKLMWDGPIEDLTLTTNTQPALMACGIAAMQALKTEFDVDINAAYPRKCHARRCTYWSRSDGGFIRGVC